MQITFIRHLPTQWNKQNILQGKRDIPLLPITEQMEKEIIRNRHRLHSMKSPDLILTSSLKRTYQTARLYGFEPETDALLDELDFGPFEGKKKTSLFETFGDKWLDRPSELILGESVREFENRIFRFIEKYFSKSHILIFGHGCWIRGCLSLYYFGTIDKMNRLSVRNNEMIFLFPPNDFHRQKHKWKGLPTG